MSEPNHVGELEVHADLPFERRVWVIQRFAWCVMLLFVLAALFGAFGRGPLAHAHAGLDGGPIQLEYDRFARYASPDTLTIQLAGGVAQNGKARIWVDRKFIQSVKIEDISPEPERVEGGDDGLVYVFPLADATQPATMVFFIEHDAYGSLPGAIGLEGQEPLHFSQFIFP